LGTVQQFPVDADVILFRIGLRAEFGHCLPVHLDVAARDQFLCLAAGGNPSSGDDFLQAFDGHGILCSTDVARAGNLIACLAGVGLDVVLGRSIVLRRIAHVFSAGLRLGDVILLRK